MKKLLLLGLLFILGGGAGIARAADTRFVIVGLDHDHVWSRMKGLLQTPGAQLVAIADTHPELIEKAKALVPPSVKFFSDYTEMLDAMKPDVAIVTTANSLHLPILRACARRHINYFTEKPMASSGADARDMARLANEAGIKLMVNYWNFWSPATQEAAAQVKAGEVGPVQKIIVEFGHEGPKEIGVGPEFLDWLTDPAKNGAGALYDFGCYGVDLTTWLMRGETPISVTAVTNHDKPEIYPRVDDDSTIILEYPHAQAVIMGSWNWPFSRKDMEVYGATGYAITVGPDKVRLRLPHEPEERLTTAPSLEGAQQNSLSYLAAVLRGQLEPKGDLTALDTNVIVMQILDAARESARTDKSVKLNRLGE